MFMLFLRDKKFFPAFVACQLLLPVWVQYFARGETGDSRVVTSIQEVPNFSEGIERSQD